MAVWSTSTTTSRLHESHLDRSTTVLVCMSSYHKIRQFGLRLLRLVMLLVGLVAGRRCSAFQSTRQQLRPVERRLIRRLFSHWSYEIESTTPSPSHDQSVLEWLVATNTFPSASQARRACKFGRVIIKDEEPNSGEQDDVNDPAQTRCNVESSTRIAPGKCLAILTRSPDDFYPTTVTGYIAPPVIESSVPEVVYQDNEIAIMNKPENLTTIAGATSRNDLQSMLPFLLKPPPPSNGKIPLPRPVHRLDRRTSGLVLVAKTDTSRRKFSQAFENRKVQKTYTAIVIGKPNSGDLTDGASYVTTDEDGIEWNVIDYPIDGKDAVSSWRILDESNTIDGGCLSLLEIRPKTGRYHQIRRHLSYCLGTPIVGDAKYDGGGDVAKALRHRGMFLCSNALEIQHQPLNGVPENDEVTSSIGCFRVDIPLPSKFQKLMQAP